jgi:2'-hydroxyisoflavone reductase
MRILVLGGTGWLGGAVARVALARGHEVTCLARGSSAVPAGVTWVHADRDADDALEPVIRDDWDAVIDVSRTPQHVRRAARDLAGRVGRAVFVSTASVYADQATPGAAEESATLPARDPGTITTAQDYGSAKVMCEQIYRAAFGSERTHVARLGLIGGPGDVSDRSGYWPWRFARAATSHAPVLVPEGGERLVSLIDVRDAAAWLLDRAAGTDDEPGTVDVTGVPHPFVAVSRARPRRGRPPRRGGRR